MKKLIYILLLFAACKSPEKKVANAEKDTVHKAKPADTLFLQKELDKDHYHAVYIEHNRSATAFKALLDFKYDHNDSIAYNASYKVLKIRNHKPLKKYDLAGLPQEWLPLNLYKGKYYLYAPVDWANIDIRKLTDSTLTYYSMDGPDVKPLLNFKKINEHKYSLKSLPFYQFVKSSNINIYIIDPKNKITVWEDTALPEKYRYRLYVAKENAGNFDAIVNYCKNDKVPEYVFEKIDYKALIKGL